MSTEPRSGEERAVSDQTVIEETIIAEWWLLNATLTALYRYPHPSPTGFSNTISGRAGLHTESKVSKDGMEIGSISLTETGLSTRIRISTTPVFEPYWHEILANLRTAAETALRIRYFAGTDPIDAAIRLYYERREKGEKITLRQIAEQTGLSYNYLRKRKSFYDKQKEKTQN
jgi:hypothetical protein